LFSTSWSFFARVSFASNRVEDWQPLLLAIKRLPLEAKDSFADWFMLGKAFTVKLPVAVEALMQLVCILIVMDAVHQELKSQKVKGLTSLIVCLSAPGCFKVSTEPIFGLRS
jgi:hypothetical protein